MACNISICCTHYARTATLAPPLASAVSVPGSPFKFSPIDLSRFLMLRASTHNELRHCLKLAQLKRLTALAAVATLIHPFFYHRIAEVLAQEIFIFLLAMNVEQALEHQDVQILTNVAEHLREHG